MEEYGLSFSPSSSVDAGSFKLLELPNDLGKLVEGALDDLNPLSLTIKGQPGEDAVLCTSDQTYTMRSVVLSNSVLMVTAPPDSLNEASEGDVVIRDQVNEILELAPAVPKLHKLGSLLRDLEYGEGQEDEDLDGEGDLTRRKFTYQDAQSEIQASDAELDRGLREKHILNINGQLRPIAPAHLSTILELLLNLLVSLSLSHGAAPIEELTSALADEHEVPRQVSTQVMSWFGDVREGKWKMDVNGVVKEVGLGILRHYKDNSIATDTFLTKWKSAVGDTFESTVSLTLLSGNYLISSSLTSDIETLSYFPASSLPVDPAARFADLFLTRSRWSGDDISPFLAEIAVNSKEQDKLLLKFARATTNAQGICYTARTQYNG